MSEGESSVSKYNHQDISDELDRLNKQLEDMKSTLINTSVRAHLLEVDLATLFDPGVAESVCQACQDCDICIQAVYGDQPTEGDISG